MNIAWGQTVEEVAHEGGHLARRTLVEGPGFGV